MTQGTLRRVVGRLDTIDECEQKHDTSPRNSSRHVPAVLAQEPSPVLTFNRRSVCGFPT
jgi:hypothetical protein